MNNQLVECKENIFTKIKNFFKGLFFRKEDKKYISQTSPNINGTEKNGMREDKIDKRSFLELYEKSKKGEVDLFSLSPEKLEKMCELLEEEIKIKRRNNEIKRAKLNAY